MQLVKKKFLSAQDSRRVGQLRQLLRHIMASIMAGELASPTMMARFDRAVVMDAHNARRVSVHYCRRGY